MEKVSEDGNEFFTTKFATRRNRVLPIEVSPPAMGGLLGKLLKNFFGVVIFFCWVGNYLKDVADKHKAVLATESEMTRTISFTSTEETRSFEGRPLLLMIKR